MDRRTLVVVNPKSRNGYTGRHWKAIEVQLRDALGPIDAEHTRGPRDAERITREAVRSGVERVIVAGGDGTLNEVITGLLSAELGGYAQLGFLPLGTGLDFGRSAGCSNQLENSIASLADGKTRTIDAGRIRYRGRDGRDVTGYFANVASMGLSGLVDEVVSQGAKRLGGRVSFLLGTLRALLQYRSEDVSLRVDGRTIFEGPLVLAAAANGRFFGGGMRVAPNAQLDDGQLDVVVVPHMSKPQLISRLPRLYAGTHLAVPGVLEVRGRVLEADAAPGSVRLDIDGEPLGHLPATCEVLPGAITLFGLAS